MKVGEVLLKTTLERKSQVIDLTYKALEVFAYKIKQWKSENAVKTCKTCGQYYDSKGIGASKVPKGKVVSKDSITFDNH